MKLVARCKAEQNQAVLDPWTVVHLAAGLAAGLVGMPFRWSIAASVAYEVVEQVAERRQWGKELFETAGPETLPNAVADTAVFALGHRLGAGWNATRQDDRKVADEAAGDG